MIINSDLRREIKVIKLLVCSHLPSLTLNEECHKFTQYNCKLDVYENKLNMLSNTFLLNKVLANFIQPHLPG
jgi:hypothetical protein